MVASWVDVQGEQLPLLTLGAQWKQDVKDVEVMKTDLRPGVLHIFKIKYIGLKVENNYFETK